MVKAIGSNVYYNRMKMAGFCYNYFINSTLTEVEMFL